MNDGIMYVWNVIGDYHDYAFHSCARKETAEYLRDWCEAYEENGWRDISKSSGAKYDRYHPKHQEFSIEEGEVIL